MAEASAQGLEPSQATHVTKDGQMVRVDAIEKRYGFVQKDVVTSGEWVEAGATIRISRLDSFRIEVERRE